MYSRKLLLSSILICLNGGGSSQVMLHTAGLFTLNTPADAAASSAISKLEQNITRVSSSNITHLASCNVPIAFKPSRRTFGSWTAPPLRPRLMLLRGPV